MSPVHSIRLFLFLLCGSTAVLVTPTLPRATPTIPLLFDAAENEAEPIKAFKQGVELGLAKNSPAPFAVQYSELAQGDDTNDALLKTTLEQKSAPLIMYWSAANIAPVAPALNESNVVGLVAWDVTKQVIRQGRTVFGFGYSTEASFQGLAKYAGNTLKSYRFGLISSSEPRFDTQAKAFSEQTKSLGNTVVFDEKVDSASADFAGLLARAKKESCDSLFAALPAPALIAFVKATRAAGYKGKIFVGDALFSTELATLGKDAEGIYMVQAWSDDAALKEQFVAKFGTTPDGVALGAAALGFDAVSCVAQTGSPLSSDTIAHSFLSTPCEGLTGKTGFSGERIAQRKKRILTVKNGEFALLE